MGKMLVDLPSGTAGKSIAIQMDDIREKLLMFSILHPWSPKALGSSLNLDTLKVLWELQKTLRSSLL